MGGLRGKARDERVGGDSGSRREGREGKAKIPKAGGEERRKIGVKRDRIRD